MKKIVIVGAGPMGLYAAIKLKQLGFENVTVIDPRAGTYTRPGDLDPSIFKMIESEIGHDIPFSSSRHIKEMERALYKIATDEYGIHVERKKFSSFSPGGMMVSDTSKEPSFLPCDLVFDATGARRVLVNEVNAQISEKPFNVERVAENPVKNFFIAYVKVDSETQELLDNPLIESKNPVTHTLAMERLRSEFGWSEFDEPFFRDRPLDKNKVCFYFETPPSLKPEQQEAWLSALLELKTGKKDVRYERLDTRANKKPIFIPYTVDPHRITTLYYEGNDIIPMLIPIGDAQIEPEARLGIGIESGTERMRALLDSITINDGDITIDMESYKTKIEKPLSDHVQKLRSFYNLRSENLIAALDREKNRYEKAFQMVIDDASLDDQLEVVDNILDTIGNGLTDIASKYIENGDVLFANGDTRKANQSYRKAIQIHQDNFNNEAFLFYFIDNIFSDNKLRNKELFKMILAISPDTSFLPIMNKMLEKQPLEFNYNDVLDIIQYAKPKTINADDMNALLKHVNDTPNSEGYSLLHQAVRDEELNKVATLLALGANPNHPNNKGETPILTAVKYRNDALIELLLKHGANATDEIRETQNNKLRALDILSAIESGDDEEVKKLLEIEAHPDYISDFQKKLSPSLKAAIAGCHIELVRLLLEKGANPNHDGIRGRTPLMDAAVSDSVPIMKLLLTAGADATKKDNRGHDFIYYLVSDNEEEVKALVVESQANNNKVKTPIASSLNCFGVFLSAEKSKSSQKDSQHENKDNAAVQQKETPINK